MFLSKIMRNISKYVNQGHLNVKYVKRRSLIKNLLSILLLVQEKKLSKNLYLDLNDMDFQTIIWKIAFHSFQDKLLEKKNLKEPSKKKKKNLLKRKRKILTEWSRKRKKLQRKDKFHHTINPNQKKSQRKWK